MYCRHVALSRHASAFLAVHLLDIVVPIIEGGSEMRGGATGLTATDWPIIDQHHGATRASKQISRRHAGNPGPNNADVGPQVLGKRLKLWDFGGVHPDGGRVTRVAVHG